MTYDIIDSEGTIYTMKYINGWGLYEDGQLVIEHRYQSIEYIDYMDGWIVNFRGSIGFFNSDFEEIINEDYDAIMYLPYGDGFFKVYKNGNQGIFDMNGNQIVYPKYDYIGYDSVNDTFLVRNGEVYGLFSSDGTVLANIKYLSVLYINTEEEFIVIK